MKSINECTVWIILEICTVSKTWKKFRNLKVGQGDLDYDSFWPTSVPLLFYALQSIYVLHSNPIASAVWEIFTGSKSRSHKLDRTINRPSFCMPSKLHIAGDAHSIFEIFSFSRSKDIGLRILKIWASSAILDSTLSVFSQFCLFHAATEYHLVKSERNLSTRS